MRDVRINLDLLRGARLNLDWDLVKMGAGWSQLLEFGRDGLVAESKK